MYLASNHLQRSGFPPCSATDRLMWITPDRLFYIGLLGAPSVRTMGSVIVYVAVEGDISVSIEGGEWQAGQLAVVHPYVRHQVQSQTRLINVIQLEAETVDLAMLPEPLLRSGIVDAPAFVDRVRARKRELCAKGDDVDLMTFDFDKMFFGKTPSTRSIDGRILAVMETIKRHPSAPASAEECAEMAHLSVSRFLHLFTQEVGVAFRSFRTWKRARSLLHYVNRDSNLAYIALETGYADSTHFSHSIRQVFGLKPKDIFAGSRRLAVYANALYS
jgi:AraC-like DNA-binding protein